MTVVWLNGHLLERGSARIDPADRGFTLGDGLFETIRVEHGVPRRLAAHLQRLRHGAALLGLAPGLTDEALHTAMLDVLRAAGLAYGSLRLTLSRGPAGRGVLPPSEPAPTCLITAAPSAPSAPPARLIVARTTRRNEFSPLARIKSLNYLDGILARQEAAAAGRDDAILLNTRGQVAETSICNIFLRLDGRWLTPPIHDGALPGIARAALLASGFGEELSLPHAALNTVDAALLTNSLGVRQVASLSGRALDLAWPLPAIS